MDVITLLIFLMWAACGVLVVNFVVKTGGTKVGKVAHWFGGAFVMFGFAVALILIYANLSVSFGSKVNAYLLTHQLRSGSPSMLVQDHAQGTSVTVYRRGSVNTTAARDGDRLIIDEHKTIRTSLWWMLWNTSYTSPDS